MDNMIEEVMNEKSGFLKKQELAEYYCKNHTLQDCLQTAQELYKSSEYQIRCFAVFIFGNISRESDESLVFLKGTVGKDINWRVQEVLAKAFDKFCSGVGYEKALPVIIEWLEDENPNIRRAVTEGLRIWTNREYFKTDPGKAVELLSGLKNDKSEYVRKSVGNSLRDISKKHKDLIKYELDSWNLNNREISQVYKLAVKFINKGKA